MGGTTDDPAYSRWMGEATPACSSEASGSASGDVRPTEAERQALMAAYLLGRRHGIVATQGPLARLVGRWSPDGALLRLAEAYVEAGRGRYEAAATQVAMTPLRDRARRDAEAAKLRRLAQIAKGQRPK